MDIVGRRMPEFESSMLDAGETGIHIKRGGSGPAVLLLHGFPETLAMWREIASLLAERFSVVCADLRGYGASGCPPSAGDHVPYSKRALAGDMVAVMTQLGFERFSIAGHDRGGRVAYRAALDAPDRVERLAVLDVVPIDSAWDRADDRLALGFWPWSLLAQPEPLPERLVGAAPEAVIDEALSMEWGTPADTFDEGTRAEYLAQLQDPDHVHAICEEYRAAARIDREHDRADRLAGRQIACPVLVLWSAAGPLGSWYVDDGGPLELWRELAPNVTGHPVEGGHFFPEEHPQDTAEELAAFFSSERD
jgi:haloacetate dehalogenase